MLKGQAEPKELLLLNEQIEKKKKKKAGLWKKLEGLVVCMYFK